MPYSYRIDAERHLVITTVWGEFTLEIILEHQSALTKDPAFDPGFYQLVDLTQITEVSLDAEAIRTAATRRIFAPGSRRAIVVPSPELFGLARMFATYREIYGGGEDMQIFTDKEEATRWLLAGPDAS